MPLKAFQTSGLCCDTEGITQCCGDDAKLRLKVKQQCYMRVYCACSMCLAKCLRCLSYADTPLRSNQASIVMHHKLHVTRNIIMHDASHVTRHIFRARLHLRATASRGRPLSYLCKSRHLMQKSGSNVRVRGTHCAILTIWKVGCVCVRGELVHKIKRH